MESRSTKVAAILALPVILLFGLVAAIGALAGAVVVGSYAVAWWNSGPNYSLPATASCLRAHGYAVSRLSAKDFFGYPVIRASRGGNWLDAHFTPNADDADRLATRIYSGIERRNVVFDSGVELPRDRPIVACLSTG